MADINLGVGGANSATGGYEIANSVKTEATANEWFYRSSPTQGNRQTFTFSLWHKRTQITGYPADPYLMSQGSNARFHITGNANPTLRFMFGGSSTELESSPRIRDTSAWYHIVLAVDTTQSTASNRVKLYVNGEQISWDNGAYPSQNATSTWMSTTNMYFNTFNGDGAYDASGYYAEICVIDGQQLAPTDFGEFDNVSAIWKPKDVSGLTFGNEGFYLDFEDSSDLGADVSGNNNDCTLNNIAAADQATDTPTNNFCIINTIEYTGGYTYTNGGTQAERNANTAWYSTTSTMGVSKGKWYWEAQFASGASSFMAGVSIDSYISTQANPFDGQYLGSGTGDGGFGYNNAGHVYYNDTITTNYGSAPSTNIMGFAIDMDNEKAYVSINGTWQNSGDPTSGATGTGAIDLTLDSSGDTAFFSLSAYNPNYTHKINFGGYTTISISSAASDANGYGTFEYAPPSGYYALCTKNLAEYG